MATVGENIKAARIAAGFTQEELAQKIGTTKSAISRYELGKREPSLSTIAKISISLGIRTEAIMELEAFDSPEDFDREWKRRTSQPGGEQVTLIYKASGEVQIIDQRKERLSKNYDNLDEEGQKQLVKYSDYLVSELGDQ